MPDPTFKIDGATVLSKSGTTVSVDSGVHHNGTISQPFQYYCQLQLQAIITVGSSETLVNNWEEPTINSNIGTAVTEDSSDSGIFQFPATGKWWVEFRPQFYINDSARWIETKIQRVISGTSTSLIRSHCHITRTDSDNTYQSDAVGILFDCTNTSTDKVKFTCGRTGSGTLYCLGGTGNQAESVAFFYRIGNT